MDVPRPSGKEKIIYQSRLLEIVRQPMRIGRKKAEFEVARRSPGVRLLIVRGHNILLTKEFRSELGKYDYRLPGGKVFDSISEYHSALKRNKNILVHAINAAKKECVEETGIRPLKIKHVYTSKAGATIVWDLFYFLIPSFKAGKQKPGVGEVIHPEWYSFRAAEKMCLDGSVREDRTVAVLLRFLFKARPR